MGTYKNRQAVKYITIAVVTFVISLIVYIITASMLSDMYRQREMDAMTGIISSVCRQYPDVDVTELINVINSPQNTGNKSQKAIKADDISSIPVESKFANTNDKERQTYDMSDISTESKSSDKGYEEIITNNASDISIEPLLLSYGIDEKAFAVRSLSGLKRSYVLLGGIILAVSGIIYLGIFILYLRKRTYRLEQLSRYMDMITAGNYNLDLENNTEDELSSLKNQLYKLMVWLKEQTDNAIQNKVALAQSVSDISHQLKTPLTSAQILLDNLIKNPDMEAGLRKQFTYEVFSQVSGMNWMIVSMLKLSRIDAGVVEFEKEEVCLAELIKEASDNLAIISEIKNVPVNVCTDTDCVIYGDYNWNREAIQNIIKNAIEHSNTGENVNVKTEDNDVYTAVYITNTGEKLTDMQQKQIFERYYSEAKFEDNSMGIGLPLAKAVVEKQGGYITVDSNEDKTTFIVKYIKM